MLVEPSKCNVHLQKQNVRAQDEVWKKKPYVMYGGEPAHVSPKIIYHRGTCHPPVSNSHLQCWRCSALMRTKATDGAEIFQNWNDRTFYLRGVSFVTSRTRREVAYFFTGMLESEKQSWLVNIDFWTQYSMTISKTLLDIVYTQFISIF